MPMLPRAPLGAFAGVALLGAALAGCDSCSGSRGGVTTADAARSEAEESDAAVPTAAAAPSCTGAELDMLAVLADPACAIGANEARKLRAATDDAGTAAVSFRQTARLEDDGTVVVRVTNAGTRAATVPLLDHPDLPAFTALAQEKNGPTWELAAPAFAPRAEPTEAAEASDGGAPLATTDAGTRRRARIARATVPPGGVLFVRLAPSTRIVKRVQPTCPDGGPCGPDRLAPGAYILHLGQLIVDVEAGAPARVAWLAR